MPFYEYQCTQCGHRLEVLQKISEPPVVDCPSCHNAALKKLISASAFHLKGNGWYVTDFRNSDKQKDAPEKPAAADSQAPAGSDGAPKTSESGTAAASSGSPSSSATA